MTGLLDLSLAAVGEQIRARAVSCAELVEATLRRIEATEPVVHAYATVTAESARANAARLDRELAAGHWRGPMHGVPIAVKDICYTAGVPTEAGSEVMAGFVPTYDAAVVELLAEAGAITIGKSHTHEFAYGVDLPPTRCPWDLACYPGGSSTGSGVAVSFGSAYAGVGTDTGGSIRVPASIENIVGLKPTFGRVSRYGVVPLSTSLDHVGPMTRTVEDNAIFLQAMAGYDPRDSGSVDEPVPDYRARLESGVRGLTLGIERDWFFYAGVTDAIRALVEGVIGELEGQGARIVEVSIPHLELLGPIGLTVMLAEASTLHRRRLRQYAAKYDPAVRLLAQLGELIPATHYLTAQRARAFVRQGFRQAFEDNGLEAMLWPTLPVTTAPFEQLAAPREDGAEGTAITAMVHHTFQANITGQPALSVPCGLADNGLPVGFQLLGRPFDEATLFRIGRAYEREHNWPSLSPPLVSPRASAA
jgi:aspartyl-tRNA(Asn)/glutamyl-tRNA(Gln) amidotransferase subunit A